MTAKEEIINYLKEMAESDNRGTADPFYYTIQTEVLMSTPLEDSDQVWYYSDELKTIFESKEAYVATLDNMEYSSDDIEGLINDDDITIVGRSKVWENKGMFLTEEEAKRHLKQNAYHYSENARTYVEHAWRAPKMQAFFKNLFEYFEVERKNDSNSRS